MNRAAPPRAPLSRALDVIAIAVAIGIAAGWLHTLELTVARHVQHQLVWFSRDFVWMSPLAYTLLLAPAALVLAVVGVFSPSPWVLRVAVFSMSLFAIFGVLLPYSQIARIAALLLAAGAAVQFTRAASAGPVRWILRFRRTALGGAVLVALMALVLPRWRDVVAGRAIDTLPTSSAAAPPANVLLIILDTVRAASMSLYGAPDSTTPHLEEWARDATVFDAAYSVAPWTLPSHASLFTGRFAGEVTADWKSPLDRSDSTLAELFRVRGYATGGFMANVQYTAWDSGLDRGFATYLDYRRSLLQLLRSSAWTQTKLFDQLRFATSPADAASAILHPDLSIDSKHLFDRKSASEVTRQFLNWHARIGNRPYFAVLNYFDAHQPYAAPLEYRRFYGGNSRRARYHAAIAYLDASIDSVFRELRRRNTLDNTVVIVTSDHGELFNEHGLTGHAHDLYRNVLHVPLLLRFPPGVPAGIRVRTTVSLRDVPSTILDLTSLAGASVPGHSLRGYWTNAIAAGSPAFAEVTKAPNVDTTYPTAKGPMQALFDDSTHYIRNGDSSEELYRFRDDTSEATNLAASSSLVATPWKARVDSILTSRRRPK